METQDTKKHIHADEQASLASPQQKRLFNSPELFGSQNEILIRHKGEIYRIKITRNDKLIMNK